MCPFHVCQRIEDNGRTKYGHSWEAMKADYEQLQLAHTAEIFGAARELFLRDLVLGGHAEFAQYFNEQWVSKLPNWFEGAVPGYPSTNNANESMNGKLKKDLKKTPLGGFVQCMLNIVKDASCNSAMHDFLLEPSLGLHMQTTGYEWLNSVNVLDDIAEKVVLIPLPSDTGIRLRRHAIYYIKASTNDGYTLEMFKRKLADPNCLDSFDEYKQWRQSFYVVSMHSDLGRLFCSCPASLKHYTCKHVIGIRLLHEEGFDVSPHAKTTLIAGKRGKGRSKKN